MALKTGQLVKFTVNSRFSEWKKGDLAEIWSLLAEFPYNQQTVYLVKLDDKNKLFWATEDEISPSWRQLSLF